MLRIWIFFNKQTTYLEETTAERNNQERERKSVRESRAHSFLKISTSTTEYVPLGRVLRESIRHFQSSLSGNCEWFKLSRLTASFIWFREFELDYDYLMICCLSQKISGREIAGVWKLARLVTAYWSIADFQRWREMSERQTAKYRNGSNLWLDDKNNKS